MVSVLLWFRAAFFCRVLVFSHVRPRRYAIIDFPMSKVAMVARAMAGPKGKVCGVWLCCGSCGPC